MFRKRTLTCTDMDVDGKHNLMYYSSPGTIKILSPPFPWYSPKGFLWPWQQNCQFQFSAFRIPSSLHGTMAFDFLFLEVSVRQAYVLVHFYRGKRGNPSWLFRRAFNEFQIQIEVFAFPWQNSMLLGGRYRRKLPGPPVFLLFVLFPRDPVSCLKTLTVKSNLPGKTTPWKQKSQGKADSLLCNGLLPNFPDYVWF